MKFKSLFFALVVAVVAMSMAGDAQQRPAAQTDIPRLSFEKFTLPNGLEVILSEDHRLPLAAVNLWYHVGPANEEPGRTGFAHLFEHMMFQGSKHVPGDTHFRVLEGAGATGVNGTTDFDRTNYFETVPSSELALALWLESDRMGYLLDELDQANLSNQQDVVRNERRQVTPDGVKTFAQKQLRVDARTVVYGVPGQPDFGPQVPTPRQPPSAPGTGAESVNVNEPWRNEQPKPAASKALQLPVPASFRLSNGLTVIVNERPGLSVVSASLVLKTGSDANPPGKPGLANFTAAMLDQGTTTRSALQIADEVARLGGTLAAGSALDAMQVTAGSLKRTFPSILDLVADVVRRPSFPAEEIERQRASRLAALVQQRENANAAANAAMLAALYGHEHAYGFTELGTEASSRAINRADLQSFWAESFIPNEAAFVVSGQVTTTELKPLVEKAFGDWPPSTPARHTRGAVATTTARLVFVDKPGAPQTALRVASIGAPRSTPDYEPLLVMNESLGGLFSSRINLNLREEHGYTYGARSQFLFHRAAGPFLVASGVRTDVTAQAVSEIFKEVQRMRATSLAPEELRLAKDSLVRSLPAQFETSARVTASTANLFIYDLGLDYYIKYPARLSAVTADQVRAVAHRYIVPEKLIVIAVGDQAKIEPELAKLMLGPTEVRTSDGSVAAQAVVR